MIKRLISIVMVAAALLAGCSTVEPPAERPLIGVALLVHGGFSERGDAGLWDSTLQIFAYDPNSFVYQKVIWNEDAWPLILKVGNAPKEQRKYDFEYQRIGGTDPATEYTEAQVADMSAALRAAEDELGVRFMTDYVSWIGDVKHLPHPRHIYNPGVEGGSSMNYCGATRDNPAGWDDCDPQRYNTDGTIDRMLKAGVEEILVIDLTTSGVRFFKSNDVIRLSREVIDGHNTANGTNVTLRWLNDPKDLMRASYPDEPANWTSSLGAPEHDPRVPLAGNPNPVSSDPAFARLHAEGVLAHLNRNTDPAKTGVMLVNHATRRHNQLFDPKIDDTLILNANIRDELLNLNPQLRRTNIVGSWMGIKEKNSRIKPKPPTFSQYERTREMRGENLGYAYLYETDEQMPDGEWGFMYWEALEYLKDQGVEHIIVGFPQIIIDSVLNMVELPNQIAKEIGYKTWLYIDEPDFDTYPEVGHPFTDYWGMWVETECPRPDGSGTGPCCFTMGGCSDGRPYPPPRLAAADEARDDMDPSLAYEVSEYGHLGYDQTRGTPDPDAPVQNQYTGTWATWTPPNTDPRIGRLLAKHVIEFLRRSEP